MANLARIEDQYYADYVQEKTSEPLTADWSELKEIFSLVKSVTFGEAAEITAGLFGILAMVCLFGSY